MPTTARPPLRTRVFLALAGLAAVVAAPLTLAAPAQAHDALLSGTPKSGTAIEVAPDKITLTFSGELKELAGQSNAIEVTDRDGKEYTSGAVSIDGTKLSRALTAMPAGTYDVRWSALSSDGHRIHSNDDYAFTVTKGEKAEAAPKTTATKAPATAKPAQSGAATQAPATQAALATETAPTILIMWVVVGFLVLAIVLGIILQLTRKKPSQDQGQDQNWE